MFDRISRSFSLARSSWNVLYTDKKLIVFPILSAIGVLLVLASFLTPIGVMLSNGMIKIDPNGDETKVPIWVWGLLFAFYFCTWFVIIFCNSALVSCALLRFNGQEPTIGDGLRAAAARFPQIAAWALVAATVGLILKMIESAHEKVGQIISALLGTAWSVITYFVVPILVVEKVGPFDAIRRSVTLLKKTWGEALVGHLGLGLVKFLLALPGFLILAGGVFLAAQVEPFWIGLSVAALGVVWLLCFAAVGAALDTIFLTALYQYAAHDRVPDGFEPSDMEQAFRNKKAA